MHFPISDSYGGSYRNKGSCIPSKAQLTTSFEHVNPIVNTRRDVSLLMVKLVIDSIVSNHPLLNYYQELIHKSQVKWKSDFEKLFEKSKTMLHKHEGYWTPLRKPCYRLTLVRLAVPVLSTSLKKKTLKMTQLQWRTGPLSSPYCSLVGTPGKVSETPQWQQKSCLVNIRSIHFWSAEMGTCFFLISLVLSVHVLSEIKPNHSVWSCLCWTDNEWAVNQDVAQ